LAAVALAGFLLWPKSAVVAQVQVNADGCTCSRPTMLVGPGRSEAAVFHCVCPGTQCVITATQPTATQPANVAQSCR
jgi:hypothetical protein